MEKEYTESRTIGKLLLEAGKLKATDADKILKVQREFDLRFGDAAIKLGLVSEEDILQVVSQQFEYSCLRIGDESVSSTIITAFSSSGKNVEALRGLRSQLSLRWFTEKSSLVVTSPRKDSGTSYISANLAVMFSQLGQKTLLVDANMHNPSQQNNFKLTHKQGLSDVLAKRASVVDVANKISGLENLSVLSSGTCPPNPLELLGHGRFEKLKTELYKHYEVVIIDTPPMLEYCDAQSIISVSGGALIVANRNETSVADINEVKQQIILTGSEPVGVVINDAK